MGNLCRGTVKLFLNLELSRLRKARKCSLPSSLLSKSFKKWNQTNWHWAV